jgi:uncharacterized membrane protein
LLVLNFSISPEEFDDIWGAIGEQWPHYLGYVTSFLTIGGLWMIHHAVVRRMRYADPVVMRLNLALLMAVAFLPFPTHLAADAIKEADAERAAVILYGATLFAISALIMALARYVAGREELVHEGVEREHVEAALARTLPGTAFYVAALALALPAPRAAAFVFLAIALGLLVPTRPRAGTRKAGPSSRAP